MAGNLDALMDRSFPTTAGARTLRELLDPARATVFISYPMDFTPVCTAQMCSYRDEWEKLAALPVRWWGINQAAPEKHERFKSEKGLPMDLVTDADGALLRALGLWGILRTRRGFAVVSPRGELLGSTSVFPFFYQKAGKVAEFVKPLAERAALGG